MKANCMQWGEHSLLRSSVNLLHLLLCLLTIPIPMPKTSFYVNTAMVCFNCRRSAVVRLMQSWRVVALHRKETEVLDVVFVACSRCLTLPHVHNPGTALIPKYLDTKIYSDTIDTLIHIFNCSPTVLKEKRFCITTFTWEDLTMIRDILEIFYMPSVPDANIMILENGREIRWDCRFFHHDPPFTVRDATRYPPAQSVNYKNLSAYGLMPFIFVANQPLIQHALPEGRLQPPLCPSCLADLQDSPPSYTTT
ncbi:hypothetical protein L207DRAFT_308264 [Hyaloscypha variabilis F]|uniref:Uncharacterized protein n=1 Tax=Hyaloscypha variabilis (strain UAMH 11265 / GT02V1 / F) TaxID=1149755 RepID=A0A2J6RUX4_HYAVF|nr:hypothetical protein L207DRAFT_308264 [Hyaloscypha variabilis F]